MLNRMLFPKVKDIKRTVQKIDGAVELKDVVAFFKEVRDECFVVVDAKGVFTGVIDRAMMLDFFLNDVDLSSRAASHVSEDFAIISEELSLLDIFKLKEKYLIAVDNMGQYTGIIIKDNLACSLVNHCHQAIYNIDVLLNSSYNGIIVINQNGEIILFNTRAEEITGIKGREVLGKHIEEVIPGTELYHILKMRSPQYGQKIKIGNATVLVNRTIIEDNGKIIGAMSTFQDISEVEKLLNELSLVKNFKEELDDIINSSYDGIYITDPKGLTLRVNKAYERITGIKAEEVVGLYMYEIVKKGILSDSLTDKVVKTGAPITMEQVTKTGKKVIITGSPIFDKNNSIKMVVTNVRDITELSDLREELARSKELTDKYRRELLGRTNKPECISVSEEFNKVLSLAHKVAEVDSTVLILGESGVGKEVVAKEIHKNSKRKNEHFIKINCGAIPENLLESEFFGYEGGAFTGAKKEGKIGVFELADKGTLFLDEIAELPLNLQVKLLRVIQDGEVTRIGATKNIKVDVRILAATNQNLEEMVKRGSFRADLYYRLNVVPIFIPPLRKRKKDIPALAAFFIDRFNRKYNMNKSFKPELLDLFMIYDWPGNVRELENIIERALVTTNTNLVGPEDVFDFVFMQQVKSEQKIIVNDIMPLKKAVEEVEKQLITKAMEKYNNTYKAAEILCVSQPSVARKAKKYCVIKS